jgi:hypothetical protein
MHDHGLVRPGICGVQHASTSPWKVRPGLETVHDKDAHQDICRLERIAFGQY